MVRRKCEFEMKPRESVLTENYGLRLIRPLLAAMCVNMVLRNMINNNFNPESRQLPFPYYELDSSQILQAILIWMCLLLLAFTNYVMFNIWAQHRIKLLPKSLCLKLWDILFLAGLALDFVICLYVPVRYKTTMGFISSSLLSAEQFRIPMKIYAFVRSNVPHVLSFKPKSGTELYIPEFSKYLYFFWAPTLIYRDHYPRTNQFRWRFFLANFTDAVITAIFVCCLWESQFLSQFRDFGMQPATMYSILVRIANTIIPSLLLMFLMFYFCLHCFSNMTAELLYFADREFYTEWWYCTSIYEYTRSWNLLINNFIHTYVYRDVIVFITRGNKSTATVIVFMISLLCHECFVAITVGYVCPACTVLYTCVAIICGLLMKLEGKKYAGNVFAWLMYGWIFSLLLSALLLEHYARFNNCHRTTGTWKDIVLPRFVTCLENTP